MQWKSSLFGMLYGWGWDSFLLFLPIIVGWKVHNKHNVPTQSTTSCITGSSRPGLDDHFVMQHPTTLYHPTGLVGPTTSSNATLKGHGNNVYQTSVDIPNSILGLYIKYLY